MGDRVLKVHHASHELSEITSTIDSCVRILENKDDKNFCKQLKIKVPISKDKPVMDGGFTDYNIEEIKLNKSDIIEIAKMLKREKEIRKEEILSDLKDL